MINKLLARELRQVADRLDAGTCTVTEEDAAEIFSSIANVSMPIDEAARYLNMNQSTFRKRVDAGSIPKPHKRRGITEKMWFLRDLRRLIGR